MINDSFDWFDSFDKLRINKLTTGPLRTGNDE
jgi:hypothetical protein